MSKAMAIILGYLVAALLAGQALADLTCKDYIPVNWTTPRVRVNVVSNVSCLGLVFVSSF